MVPPPKLITCGSPCFSFPARGLDSSLGKGKFMCEGVLLITMATNPHHLVTHPPVVMATEEHHTVTYCYIPKETSPTLRKVKDTPLQPPLIIP